MTQHETDFMGYWRAILAAIKERGRQDDVVCTIKQAKAFQAGSYAPETAAHELISKADAQ